MSAHTTVARLSCEEPIARRLAAFLGESLDIVDSVCTAFEDDAGRWQVAIYFRNAPDEAGLRDLVKFAAGQAAATRSASSVSLRATGWRKAWPG